MKIISLFLSVLFLCGQLFAGDDEKNKLGKITFPLGDNYLQSEGDLKWQTAEYKMPVFENDKVKTARESRCEVTFKNKKIMRIGENSIVEITKDEAGVEEVKMSKGLAWLSLFLPWGKSKINVRTPNSVCAVRGTVYRLECDSNQTTYRCYTGKIAVTPIKDDGVTIADSTFEIGGGEELILVNDFEEYKKQQEKAYQDFKQKEMDDFERFKQQEQEEFNEMVRKDLEDFKKMNEINYKQSNFDLREDLKSDWVKWNKERDKLMRD